MKQRRTYPIRIVVNGRPIHEVVIDPHYESKHPDINDALILELIELNLDGREFQPEEKKGDWEFFMLDRIPHHDKCYRLVWCMQDSAMFLGVINCFRR